jgi:hypothetical protein
VPGEGSGHTPAGVTVDSRERFYNAIFGWPHRFQVVLAVVELTVPLAYLWLATAEEKAYPSMTPGATRPDS